MFSITNNQEFINLLIVINFIFNYLTFAILEHNFYQNILDNLYYYLIFSFVYGFFSFGIIQEIASCIVYNRNPNILNKIKQIFIKLFALFSYKSPNRILL
jgi:hypothetical protein